MPVRIEVFDKFSFFEVRSQISHHTFHFFAFGKKTNEELPVNGLDVIDIKRAGKKKKKIYWAESEEIQLFGKWNIVVRIQNTL